MRRIEAPDEIAAERDVVEEPQSGRLAGDPLARVHGEAARVQPSAPMERVHVRGVGGDDRHQPAREGDSRNDRAGHPRGEDAARIERAQDRARRKEEGDREEAHVAHLLQRESADRERDEDPPLR